MCNASLIELFFLLQWVAVAVVVLFFSGWENTGISALVSGIWYLVHRDIA
jgi:hypothetical protein